MRHQFRYVALIDEDRPIEDPLLVVRIRGRREEMFVPAQGWKPCDPRWRNWFVNVAITADHADELRSTVKPAGRLADRHPKSPDCRTAAYEGFYTSWFHYAIETDKHPFDDPLTVIQQHWTSGQEHAFTTDLIWEVADVPGRRIRITDQDARRFEEIQARRVFGDAKFRYFAVTNPFHPDVNDPPVIARERIDEDGNPHSEHYDGTWVSSSAIFHIRTRWNCGKLTRLSEKTATRLVAKWTPRPEHPSPRYFACLDKNAPNLDDPVDVVMVREEEGSIGGSSFHHFRREWLVVDMWQIVRDYSLVELDEPTRDRLRAHLRQRYDEQNPSR